MLSSNRNILLIVEGKREEPKLVESLFKAFVTDAIYSIYSFETNIHALIEIIVNDYDGDYENLEIRGVLVDMLSDEDEQTKSMLLYTKFTDVILMFDFDPQDNRLNLAQLRRMMEVFNDSADTDRGLLLLNYPAVEAVKVATALPYETFLESCYDASRYRSFKQQASEIVGANGGGHLFTFTDYNVKMLLTAIAQTVGKIQHLVQGVAVENTFPMMRGGSERLSDLCLSISHLDVLDYESILMHDANQVATLAMGTLFIAAWSRELDGAWKSCFGE